MMPKHVAAIYDHTLRCQMCNRWCYERMKKFFCALPDFFRRIPRYFKTVHRLISPNPYLPNILVQLPISLLADAG